MADFTEHEINTVYRVMAARRDMRHFLQDPLDETLLERLLGAAHMAPSVGLMQPWRFVRVRNTQLRASITRWSKQSDSRPHERSASAKRSSCVSRWKGF